MKKIVVLILVLLLAAAFVLPAQAQSSPQPLFSDNPNRPTIQIPNLISGGFDTPQAVFQFVIRMLALIGGVLAFLLILYGGYKYISSGGDPAGAEAGKKIIIGTIVGMFIIILSSVVVRFLIAIIRGAL